MEKVLDSDQADYPRRESLELGLLRDHFKLEVGAGLRIHHMVVEVFGGRQCVGGRGGGQQAHQHQEG